ncbi:MAG: nitroreductase family protein [Chlorobiaceae bacterium]
MIQLLRDRRSIRKYSAEKISPEDIEILVEAALRSPSSRGINPWHFILVDDPELLIKLSLAKQYGAEFLKNAPFAVVVCADGTASDIWVEDCSISSIIIQLTAHSMGLGSCWVQIRNRQHNETKTAETYVQELLGLPQHIKVASILAIGHPVEKKPPVPAENLQRDRIQHNRWI